MTSQEDSDLDLSSQKLLGPGLQWNEGIRPDMTKTPRVTTPSGSTSLGVPKGAQLKQVMKVYLQWQAPQRCHICQRVPSLVVDLDLDPRFLKETDKTKVNAIRGLAGKATCKKCIAAIGVEVGLGD